MDGYRRRRGGGLPRHLVVVRLAGVPIGVTPALLVAAGLLGAVAAAGRVWEAAALAGVGIVVSGSLLVHELAHGLVARYHGFDIDGVVLGMAGGIVAYRGADPAPAVEVRIAAAGPFASGVLACLLATVHALWPSMSAWSWLVLFGAWVNVANAVVNLVPLPSLDGYRIVSALWRGRRAAGAGPRPVPAVLASEVGAAEAVRRP
jgi:Zn-dependent protease